MRNFRDPYSTTYEYDERSHLTRYVCLDGDDKLDSCKFQYGVYGDRTMASSYYGEAPSGAWAYENEVDDGGRLTERRWEIAGEGRWREEVTREYLTYQPYGSVKQAVSRSTYEYDTADDAGALGCKGCKQSKTPNQNRPTHQLKVVQLADFPCYPI